MNPDGALRDPRDAHTRLRSVREGVLLTGPETLQLNLRNGCNLNCVFCWNHSPLTDARPRPWHDSRLSDEHLDAVLHALPRLRPGRVLLSGRGEPLLHPRARHLLESLREMAIPVTIQTNGVAGPSPEELVSLGVDRLLVNVSAATAEGYERVHPGRGRLGERALRRLHRLARLRRDGGGPDVTIVAIIHRGNEDEILPLLSLASEVGARSLMLKGMELASGLETLTLTEAGRERVRSSLAVATRRAVDFGIDLRAEHLSRIVDHQGASGAFTDRVASRPCYMGWYYLRVTIDGRVMFCCKDKCVDHLERRDLYTIWRSAAYHLLRQAGRAGDESVGLFDDRCRACSNFARNRQVGRALAEATPPT